MYIESKGNVERIMEKFEIESVLPVISILINPRTKELLNEEIYSKLLPSLNAEIVLYQPGLSLYPLLPKDRFGCSDPFSGFPFADAGRGTDNVCRRDPDFSFSDIDQGHLSWSFYAF